MLHVDDEKALQKGVKPGKALNNLSILVGSDYQTGFILFGKPYKVIVQAAPQYRDFPNHLLSLYSKMKMADGSIFRLYVAFKDLWYE